MIDGINCTVHGVDAYSLKQKFDFFTQVKENTGEAQPYSFGGYDFLYASRKTQKQTKGACVTVPLTNMAVQIAVRHGFGLLKPASNQKMNAGLKKLMALTSIRKEISSHDARRTYTTLAYKVWELDMYSIMMVTEHKTQKEFLKYLYRRRRKRPDDPFSTCAFLSQPSMFAFKQTQSHLILYCNY